jgi:tryptophan halogenase
MLGNVIAIGNSYGFVEPLESTAIQLILWECLLLAKHLPEREDDTHTAALLSREVAGVWDYLRGFLATHYRFNRRLDTPFWTACRSDVDLAGAAETVEMWQEGAPLVYRSFGRVAGRHLGGAVFSNFAFDTHLFGQGVPHSELAAREPPERYRRRAEAVRELVDLALPQAECLALLTGPRRDLLRDQVMSPDGWMASVEGFLQDVQWVPGGAVHT